MANVDELNKYVSNLLAGFLFPFFDGSPDSLTPLYGGAAQFANLFRQTKNSNFSGVIRKVVICPLGYFFLKLREIHRVLKSSSTDSGVAAYSLERTHDGMGLSIHLLTIFS